MRAEFDGLIAAAKALSDQMAALTAKVDNINNRNNNSSRENSSFSSRGRLSFSPLVSIENFMRK